MRDVRVIRRNWSRNAWRDSSEEASIPPVIRAQSSSGFQVKICALEKRSCFLFLAKDHEREVSFQDGGCSWDWSCHPLLPFRLGIHLLPCTLAAGGLFSVSLSSAFLACGVDVHRSTSRMSGIVVVL